MNLLRYLFKSRFTMMMTIVVFFGLIVGFNLFKSLMIKRYFANFEAPPVSVSSVSVISKIWSPHLQAVGNFVAINGVDITSQAAGNVVKINFQSGEYIEKDEPIIDIDDSVDLANLKFNQSLLALKQINYKRQVDLSKRGATSESNLDEAKASQEQSEANVEKTQAQILHKHIKAPFSGRLGIRNIDLGQYISPGQTIIVSLQSLDPLYLTFNLPEHYLKNLHIGQNILFSTDEFKDTVFTGNITALNSKVDVKTHNIMVQATLANCPQGFSTDKNLTPLIKTTSREDSNEKVITCQTDLNTQNHIENFTFIPGMFANIEIEQPAIDNVTLVPSTAISYSLYGDSVYVLSKDKDNKKSASGQDIYIANRVFVKTGDQENNYTVIEKGLKPGQLIVSAGEIKLQNGSRVVINNDVILKEFKNPNELGQ